MSLRVKLVLALAVLAALASSSIGFFSYQATASRLTVEVDRSLDDAVQTLLSSRGDPRRLPGGLRRYELISIQYVNPDGSAGATAAGAPELPTDREERQLAGSSDFGQAVRRDITIEGQRYRMLTASLGNSTGAIQVARTLSENERLLDSLRNRILLAVLGVAAAAGVLGWVVARQVTRRLSRLTATAEAVASTGRLDIPVDVVGDDEAGRLAAAFNGMLSALARSRDDQQRLVQDAGHELRTPLTSLRTNISVLRRHDRLSPETLASVLDDLESEALELTELTNELVELATDRRSEEPMEAVVLGDLAERVAARARRRTGRLVTVDADASVVNGRAQLLERAITNLVDNAAKFDETAEAPIDVVVRAGRVDVLDRGPGIAEDDLPHLFDRFYRAVAARSRPGSGLGLAIVKAVAEAHGGQVFAANRPGGGADIGFQIPC